MDIVKAKELIDAIRGNGDEALTSIEYTQLIDAMTEDNAVIEERNAEIERLNDENTKLREINQKLMLDEGKTIVKRKETEYTDNGVVETETVEITDDDIVDAINEFI